MDAVPHLMTQDVRPEIAALFECTSRRCFAPTRTLVMSKVLSDEIAAHGITFRDPVDMVPGWARARFSEHAGKRYHDGLVRFATVGTLCDEKGSSLILDALSQINPKTRERVRVEFFGRGDIAFYEQMADRLDVRFCVRFHGQIDHDDLLSALPSFDALLFPTWPREPFGFVALEAGLSGIAPIITKGIGASEVLEDGVTAIMIKRSSSAIADQIRESVDQPGRLHQIGASAREAIAASYMLDSIVDRIEHILVSVARPIIIDPGRVQRLLDLNLFRYKIAQAFMVSTVPPGTPKAAIQEVDASYGNLKKTGRTYSNGPFNRMLRSGLLKLLRPYVVELLRSDAAMQYELESLRARLTDLERDTEASS
jgi:hypothetical protein